MARSFIGYVCEKMHTDGAYTASGELYGFHTSFSVQGVTIGEAFSISTYGAGELGLVIGEKVYGHYGWIGNHELSFSGEGQLMVEQWHSSWRQAIEAERLVEQQAQALIDDEARRIRHLAYEASKAAEDAARRDQHEAYRAARQLESEARQRAEDEVKAVLSPSSGKVKIGQRNLASMYDLLPD